MKLTDIANYRTTNQQIATGKIKTAPDLVSYFAGFQAQEYALTKWALGLRLPHLTDDDIEKDFSEGKILRTHVLRPTWHFIHPKDIRWMLTLTAPRVHAANAFMYRKLELDNKVFNQCNKIIRKELTANSELTRDSINEAFKKHKVVASGHRLSYILMQAELNGIVCSGPREGNQFTYSLIDDRVPVFKTKTKEEALAELTKRYFKSRGPATLKDYSTWSGLTVADCKKGVAMEKSDLIGEEIAEEMYYFYGDALQTKKNPAELFLLPIYDEFIMGYKDRSAIFEFKNALNSIHAFRYDSTIVSNGQVIGTWKRTVKSNSIQVEYEFFKTPGREQKKKLEDAIIRLNQFFGKE